MSDINGGSSTTHLREGDQGTIIFDLDGAIYLWSTLIQGASETISELNERGWNVLYATNNSTKTRESIVETLFEIAGVSADPASVITSSVAVANQLVADNYRSAQVLGSSRLKETIAEFGVTVVDDERPDAVVVGLDFDLTYEKIKRASRAIRDGATFYATNMDPTYPTPDGVSPGAGSVVISVSTAAGVEPVVCGKPEEPMYLMVEELIRPGRVIMVGDRPDTDIALAINAGWESVLTLSGVTSDPAHIPDRYTPDRVIDSVADIEGIISLEPR